MLIKKKVPSSNSSLSTHSFLSFDSNHKHLSLSYNHRHLSLSNSQYKQAQGQAQAMSMTMESDHDTGLSLTLGRGPPAVRRRRKDPAAAEPSLTLSLSDDARLSSPHSVVSSFSAAVKREKDAAAGEEAVISYRTSDEDEDGGSRKKLRLTKEQSALLEDRFKEHSTLNPKQKQALARQLGLRPRQVEVWFQNRRARTKLKQTEMDCELLKRCCETLTDENRRLHKEVTELRAVRFAPPPLYMQLPAASLAICPSCERLAGAAGDGAKSAAAAAAPPKAHFFNPFTHSANRLIN